MRILFFLILIFALSDLTAQNKRLRDYGINPGVFKTGQFNAITDVGGVEVGHVTLQSEDHIRTGVTAIIPYRGNIFQQKVPAAIYVANGFGKLAGYTQVNELGNLETPIILTNTLSVPVAVNALISYTLKQEGNEEVRSVNAVVGETNDGHLNDIRGRHIKEEHILEAIEIAEGGKVKEGNVGAGTGTRAFGYKGGIGTSSRILPTDLGGYTVGVLVQTNFGGSLKIDGVPVGKELGLFPFRDHINNDADGSCMIVVATDAPLSERNLKRLAKRAILGLGKTGGIASNGSGDYVIAFSTYQENRIPYTATDPDLKHTELHNNAVSPLFMAVIEATEEAILNSLFMASDMTGRDGHSAKAIPIERIMEIMKKYSYNIKND